MKAFMIAVILILLMIQPCVGEPIIKPIDASKWTCYEKAIYERNTNPDMGIVLVGTNRFFYGKCHFANYKYDNETDYLYLYDEGELSMAIAGIGADELLTNAKYNEYYHFFGENEKIPRIYKYMRDNRAEILCK